MYVSADRARSAALSGSTLPLNTLESRALWNDRTDDNEIHLQYAEAHMAVRFLVEAFSPNEVMGVIDNLRGFELARGPQRTHKPVLC